MLVVLKEQDDLNVNTWLLQADDQGQVLQGLLLQLRSENIVTEEQAKLEDASSLLTKILQEELRGRIMV